MAFLSQSLAPVAASHMSVSRRRVIVGTTIGNAWSSSTSRCSSFLMLFIGPLFFPAASSYGQLLLTTATFGVGFLMRPVGALLIGSYADRFGRRSAMTLTLFMMGLGCGMMALTPTHAQIGMVAPLVIVLARLIQGFAAGGEEARRPPCWSNMHRLHSAGFTPAGSSAASPWGSSLARSWLPRS
jgi:MFS family permease